MGLDSVLIRFVPSSATALDIEELLHGFGTRCRCQLHYPQNKNADGMSYENFSVRVFIKPQYPGVVKEMILHFWQPLAFKSIGSIFGLPVEICQYLKK